MHPRRRWVDPSDDAAGRAQVLDCPDLIAADPEKYCNLLHLPIILVGVSMEKEESVSRFVTVSASQN